MKLFQLLILFVICFACKAQTISLTNVNWLTVPDGAYVKDTDGKLDVFLGTWKWTNGNDEFTVVFVKKLMYDGEGTNKYQKDIVMGGYRYINNGVEITNTLNFTTSFDVNDISTFSNYAHIITTIHSDFKGFQIKVYDKVKGKGLDGSFELTNALTLPNGNYSATQAHWRLREREFISINGNPPLPEDGIGLPDDIILTKK